MYLEVNIMEYGKLGFSSIEGISLEEVESSLNEGSVCLITIKSNKPYCDELVRLCNICGCLKAYKRSDIYYISPIDFYNNCPLFVALDFTNLVDMIELIKIIKE